jgi:hypothetical protein
VEVFLTPIAVERQGAASMQNQELAALSFLYREALGIDLPGLKNASAIKIYTHVLNRDGQGVVSPLDGLNSNFSRLV